MPHKNIPQTRSKKWTPVNALSLGVGRGFGGRGGATASGDARCGFGGGKDRGVTDKIIIINW